MAKHETQEAEDVGYTDSVSRRQQAKGAKKRLAANSTTPTDGSLTSWKEENQYLLDPQAHVGSYPMSNASPSSNTDIVFECDTDIVYECDSSSKPKTLARVKLVSFLILPYSILLVDVKLLITFLMEVLILYACNPCMLDLVRLYVCNPG